MASTPFPTSTTSETEARTRTGGSFWTSDRAMWAGVAFSALLTGLIWLLGDRLAAFAKLPDQGTLWYFWKLAEPTWITRLSAWGLYLVHQIAIFALIRKAQRENTRYTGGLHPVNVQALAVNGVFAVLHLIQTHVFYDGLAQDVSILSSQGSVIVLLVWVLLMENPRRGLFFGKRAPLHKDIVAWAKKYHGYFFSWAVIYTFWYHPMESTQGHLIGVFYTFVLMLQGSLFFTRIHVNKWWMAAQEVLVLVHGTLVALQQGTGIWPMFFFGFAMLFIVTQMHGLGLSRGMKAFFTVLFGVAVALVYSERGLAQLNEIIRIPLIDYLSVFVLAGLIGGGLWIARRLRPAPAIRS
jgi:hypothetical protein